MKTLTFDAVVIGSGCAGYNCADYLKGFGLKKVAVVTEGKNMGTSRNTGSDKQTYYKLSLAGDEKDSVYQMARTLFEGGGMDGDVALAEAANSARSFMKLVNLGVQFPTNAYGEYVGYKTDHDPCSRATSIGPYTSKKMTEVLEEAALKNGARLLDGLQVIKILTENGRVIGLVGLYTATNRLIAIRTDNVILATGGPAGIYFDSVYPLGHTGASSLAVDAGAEMRNLCEWQYGLASTAFRWNVSGTYQQVLPRYISVDENGVEYEFLLEHMSAQKALEYVFLKGYEWPFDCRKANASSMIDLLVYHQTAVLGRKVYMDFTREPSGLTDFNALPAVAKDYLANSDALIPLPIERLKKMNPEAITLYQSHGIDITRQPLEIAVCAQHNNGGVSVDVNWQSTVQGLFVVGEAAGTLGIFRPGGTALNSCQVGGLQAAKCIAYEATASGCQNFAQAVAESQAQIKALLANTKDKVSTLAQMRLRYQKRMSKCFAFHREIGEMEEALAEINADFANFCTDNKWRKRGEVPALLKNYDLLCTARIVAESMLYCAKHYGSRGSAVVLEANGATLPENIAGRSKIIACKQTQGQVQVYEKDVKPLPERNLWFEKVWGEYRQKTEKTQ